MCRDELLGLVEKAILWRSFYVGTGLVLQDESFRMNPCPNSKEDSHEGCPYDNLFSPTEICKIVFHHSL